jgi:hypothetical protein
LREWDETQTVPDAEKEEVDAIFRVYELSEEQIVPLVKALSSDREK